MPRFLPVSSIQYPESNSHDILLLDKHLKIKFFIFTAMKTDNSKNIAFILLLILLLFTIPIFSQVNYEPLNKSIYDYLDRLSIQGYFQINSEIKPFSRIYIAEKLKIVIGDENHKLTPLENKELVFYTEEYARELKRINVNVDSILVDKKDKFNLWGVVGFNEYGRFHLVDYDDSLFTFTLDPILGYKYGTGKLTSRTHLWNGLSFYGRISNWVGFDLNFRDNTQTGDNIDYTREFSPLTGFSFRVKKERGFEFDEVNANLTFSNSWGSFTIGKDYVYYGEGKQGKLILGNKAPSFPQLKLEVYPTDWFKFSYVHGWLNSQIIDSSTIRYNESGWETFQHVAKYYVAHEFSFTPWKVFNFTIGESIVYSDVFQPIYLIPVMFFRLAEHYFTHPDNVAGNAQLFGSFWYNIPTIKTKFYGTIFIDEFSIQNSDGPRAVGYTIGTDIINPVIPESEFIVEYTKIDPYVYFHHDDAQFYTNYDYQLGHWIGSNSDQVYLAFTKHIIRGLKIKGWFTYIRRGSREDPTEPRYQDKNYFLWGIRNNYTSWGITARYEIIHDVFASAVYRSRQTSEQKAEGGEFTNTNGSEFAFTLNYGF